MFELSFPLDDELAVEFFPMCLFGVDRRLLVLSLEFKRLMRWRRIF